MARKYENMSKEKQDYIDKIRSMSNRALFDEMIERQEPDYYDGAFTSIGVFMAEQSLKVVEERLKDWLDK